MGSSFASFYACLTIGYLEEVILFPELEKNFEEVDVTKVKLSYKRYMDDGIVFLPTNMEKEDFLKYLNAMNPSIIFTLEITEQILWNNGRVEKVDFLNLTIIMHENGYIETDIYYKITNAHDYVHYDSFHPSHTLNNVPYNLAKRIIMVGKM